MEFVSTHVDGAFVVRPQPHHDERGWFARIFCTEEFGEQGMETAVAQINLAETVAAGTVRGLHYQLPPAEEAKLVRCVSGSIYDVVVDTRRASPTFGRWAGVELDSESAIALYVPPGCAHGYQALADGSRALYHSSAPYSPELGRGVNLADPALAIDWPLEPVFVTDRDRALPRLSSIETSDLP